MSNPATPRSPREKEPAFNGAGKSVGLELWRIEALKPVKQPKVTGKFHVGDSYILLSTTQKNNKLAWAVHFWLGSETSDDESGIAAYKAVELDDYLGGAPVQYREVQGSESKLFLSYFKSGGGIEYVPGGVVSGFKKVERDVYEPRLLHCKGARTVRVSPVPLSNKSLNKGDVFILDLGLQIYIFNGPKAKRLEKVKGVEAATRIDSDERSGRAEVLFMDDDINNEAFWGPLGGFIDPETLPEGDADSSVTVQKVVPKLLKLSGSAFTPVTLEGDKLIKDLLTSPDVFLVHANKVYLWIGKTTSAASKKEATANALKYIKSAGLPASTSIERVSEGVETNTFKAEFSKWEIIIQKNSGVASMGVDQNIDVAALLARQQVQDAPIDDGNGTIQVWVVQNFKLVPTNPDKYGQFYGGDSYVILYTYLKNKVEYYILYFWLGDKSTADEKGAAALLAKEKDDALFGRPVQVRVVQGKEPAHLRQLFKGKNIIHAGGKASGFTNVAATDSYDTDGIALFRVRGTTPTNTQAVQVPEVAASFNSDDCFVLVTPSHAYVWNGKNSNADEQKTAINVAGILAGDYNGSGGRVVEPVTEGSEPGAFWSAVGGRGAYAATAPGEPAPKDPRLFQGSNATGSFRVEEVADFNQTDLNDEDIFLLDTYTTLFVWVGSRSNDTEKAKGFEFAQKFIAEANDGRDPDCPVITVHAGQEPLMFTAQFVGWDAKFADNNTFSDPYATKVSALTKLKTPQGSLKSSPRTDFGLKSVSSAKIPTSPSAATGSGSVSSSSPRLTPVSLKNIPQDQNTKKIIEEIHSPNASVPVITPRDASTISGQYSWAEVSSGSIPGMDLTQKELYLNDADFKAKLGCDKAAFAAVPKWKQVAKKKELGIF